MRIHENDEFQGGSKIPEVRLLTNDAIRVVDNHFSVPVSKVDDLKAPKTYPNAVSKYTLREMTVVWHMYGGHDFAKSKPEESLTAKKQVTIVSEKWVLPWKIKEFEWQP